MSNDEIKNKSASYLNKIETYVSKVENYLVSNKSPEL